MRQKGKKRKKEKKEDNINALCPNPKYVLTS